MAEESRRRRRSVQLYRDPSPWGVLAAIGFIVALIVVVLVNLGANSTSTMFSLVDAAARIV